jgi:isocitrate dehydrogenase
VDTKQSLWFSAKDTISKTYDGRFRAIFEEVYKDYKAKFETLGIEYYYTLIDDAVARVIRSKGGFIWACKIYDGDVMSDMLSTAFGSLAMMTSVLVARRMAPCEFEAAHGTVTRHTIIILRAKAPTNPWRPIYAWTGALRKRGELDSLPDLAAFADRLEKACIDTLMSGQMPRSLAALAERVMPPRCCQHRNFSRRCRGKL